MHMNVKAPISCLLALIWLLAPRPVFSGSKNLHPAKNAPVKVAVMPFDYVSNLANKDDSKGRMLSDMFTTAAVKSGVFSVVEREQVKKILEEMEFGSLGKTYTAEVQKIGDLVGANFVLTGTVTELDASIRISARLIEVESGKIRAVGDSFSQRNLPSLAAASENIMKKIVAVMYPSKIYTAANQSTPKSSPKPSSSQKQPATGLSFQVNYVYRTAGTGELKTIANGTVLTSGDYYKVIFTPESDSFVYIYQMDSSGQMVRLFPMSEFKGVRINNENPVIKGKTYVLPSSNTSFKLDRQVGPERLYFIASKEPNAAFEDLYREMQEAKQQKNVKQAEEVREKLSIQFKGRGIEEVVTDKAIGVQWEESEDTFFLLGKRLENVCKGCTHVVEFMHQ